MTTNLLRRWKLRFTTFSCVLCIFNYHACSGIKIVIIYYSIYLFRWHLYDFQSLISWNLLLFKYIFHNFCLPHKIFPWNRDLKLEFNAGTLVKGIARCASAWAYSWCTTRNPSSLRGFYFLFFLWHNIHLVLVYSKESA